MMVGCDGGSDRSEGEGDAWVHGEEYQTKQLTATHCNKLQHTAIEGDANQMEKSCRIL